MYVAQFLSAIHSTTQPTIEGAVESQNADTGSLQNWWSSKLSPTYMQQPALPNTNQFSDASTPCTAHCDRGSS